MAKHNKQRVADGRGNDRNPSHHHALLRIAMLTLAVLGILLTAYLSYTASVDTHPAFCGEDSGCDLVQSSRWAMFLKIPMALWGLLTYLTIAGLVWRTRTRAGSATALLFITVVGFSVSAYLTVISVMVINATCAYCLASFGLITAIMILAFAQRHPDQADRMTSLKEAALVSMLIVVGLHLHYSGIFDKAAGPEDPQLRALAIHLTETGATFYGAHWCPRCKEQKDLFESSAGRLPYVECSSGGRSSPLTAPCVANNIRHYPTWIIGKKRHAGLRAPRVLASDSGFTWKP